MRGFVSYSRPQNELSKTPSTGTHRVIGLWLTIRYFYFLLGSIGMNVSVYSLDVAVMRIIMSVVQSGVCVTYGCAVLW